MTRAGCSLVTRWIASLMFLHTLVAAGIHESNDSSIDTVLRTPYGDVVGNLQQWRDSSSIKVFKGLPYAKPPLGDLRWAPPDSVIDRLAEHYDARHYKPRCPSARSLKMYAVGGSESRPISEDCLYLDVVSPASTEKALLPVVVLLHGEDQGCGSISQIADIATFATERIVQVTVEHRKEVLGFLTVEEVSLFGNYALLDVIASLRWVQANIEAFGGNAEQVMVFGTGESAMLVQALLVSPLARGIFHRAVVAGSNLCLGSEENSCGLSTRGILAAEYFDSLGCYGDAMGDRLACARLKKFEDIVDSLHGRYQELQLDGDALPLQPQEALLIGAYNRMPVMVGYNRHASKVCGLTDNAGLGYSELDGDAIADLLSRHACCGQDPIAGAAELMKLYIPFTDSGSTFATIAADMEFGLSSWMFVQYLQLFSPVYAYVFSARLTNPKLANLGMMNGHDVQFLLNSTCCPANLQYAMTESEQDLGAAMRMSWASFVERGIPASIGISSAIDGEPWSSFNASGFATLHGDRVNESTLIGTHYWYAIGNEGGISISDFRIAQLAFLANWRGLMGPSPLSIGPSLIPGRETAQVSHNVSAKGAPWAMREMLLFLGVVVGCIMGLMLQRFWNWRREVRAVTRPLLPEIERMLHEERQVAILEKEADDAASFARASEARKLSEAKQVQRRRFASARR